MSWHKIPNFLVPTALFRDKKGNSIRLYMDAYEHELFYSENYDKALYPNTFDFEDDLKLVMKFPPVKFKVDQVVLINENAPFNCRGQIALVKGVSTGCFDESIDSSIDVDLVTVELLDGDKHIMRGYELHKLLPSDEQLIPTRWVIKHHEAMRNA